MMIEYIAVYEYVLTCVHCECLPLQASSSSSSSSSIQVVVVLRAMF